LVSLSIVKSGGKGRPVLPPSIQLKIGDAGENWEEDLRNALITWGREVKLTRGGMGARLVAYPLPLHQIISLSVHRKIDGVLPSEMRKTEQQLKISKLINNGGWKNESRNER